MPRVTAELTKGTVVTMTDGRHTFPADEPLPAGGTDLGPAPYELLLGSLAACTCVTVAAYCRHKGITLERVVAECAFDRVRAEDCPDCDQSKKGLIERIQSHITISGDFDEAQRERLMQVATRCPIHKTLQHGVHFVDDVRVESVGTALSTPGRPPKVAADTAPGSVLARS